MNKAWQISQEIFNSKYVWDKTNRSAEYFSKNDIDIIIQKAQRLTVFGLFNIDIIIDIL